MNTSVYPTITVLVGPPGSGKSTWRANHLETLDTDPVIISTDDLIEAWGLDHGMTYSEAFTACDRDAMEKTAKAMFRDAIAARTDVIIDRTNMTRKSRRKWLSGLPVSYRKCAIVFKVAREELDRRLLDRAITTGKSIPAKVVDEMLASFEAPELGEFNMIEYVY